MPLAVQSARANTGGMDMTMGMGGGGAQAPLSARGSTTLPGGFGLAKPGQHGHATPRRKQPQWGAMMGAPSREQQAQRSPQEDWRRKVLPDKWRWSEGVDPHDAMASWAEIDRLSRLIGDKAHFKFKNVREAFRSVDLDHSGSVSRTEIHTFFRQFALSDEDADVVFNYLDDNDSGGVDYIEFIAHFGPFIQPGVPPPRGKKTCAGGDEATVAPYAFGRSLRKLA